MKVEGVGAGMGEMKRRRGRGRRKCCKWEEDTRRETEMEAVWGI